MTSKKDSKAIRVPGISIVIAIILIVAAGGAIGGWYLYSYLQGSGTQEGLCVLEAATEPTKGCADTPVTIIEFSEFYCPYCARFAFDTAPKLSEYIRAGSVKFIFRNFPVHGQPAMLAAQAGECAHEQGRFWEYHDRLFAAVFKERQTYLSEEDLTKLATEVGLDSEAFAQCLAEERYLENVEEDIAEGQRLGVEGTPTFFINGREVVGAQPFENFKRIIEEELKKQSQV